MNKTYSHDVLYFSILIQSVQIATSFGQRERRVGSVWLEVKNELRAGAAAVSKPMRFIGGAITV